MKDQKNMNLNFDRENILNQKSSPKEEIVSIFLKILN